MFGFLVSFRVVDAQEAEFFIGKFLSRAKFLFDSTNFFLLGLSARRISRLAQFVER